MWCFETTHFSKETQPWPEIPAGRRQVGPATRPTRGHHLFRPLLAWILTGWQSTCLALALDATSLGDRFTILSISVVYRGEAIPVAWKVLHANVPHPWKPKWIALLRVFAGLVPPGWTVIMMIDRALYTRWLYQETVALGWHPVMRITHQSKFRKGRSKSKKAVPVTALVPRVGGRWQGRGVAFPKKPERRLECTLLACWEEGYEKPWFLVTDLEPDQAEGLWYGMRSWIVGDSSCSRAAAGNGKRRG